MTHAIIEEAEFEDALGADEALASVTSFAEGEKSFVAALQEHRDYIESGGEAGARLTVSGRRFKDQDFASVDLSEATFEDCSFVDCVFRGTSMDQTAFDGSEFERCDFTAVRSLGISMRRTRLVECGFGGAEFDAAEVEGGGVLKPSFEGTTFLRCSFGVGRGAATIRQPELRNVTADAASVAALKEVGIPTPILRRFTITAG
ncbi:MAG: pentapeptide repeat-containing protein, partial [Pseudomonadota bacterium]